MNGLFPSMDGYFGFQKPEHRCPLPRPPDDALGWRLPGSSPSLYFSTAPHIASVQDAFAAEFGPVTAVTEAILMEIRSASAEEVFQVYSSGATDPKTYVLDIRPQKEFKALHMLQAYSVRLSANGRAVLVRRNGQCR